MKFIWSKDKCTIWRDIDNDKYYNLKNLKKVKKLGFKLDNILIIENTPKKVHKNYGNAIYVKDFEGDENDIELKLLSIYLLNLYNFNEFRLIEKRDWKNKV